MGQGLGFNMLDWEMQYPSEIIWFWVPQIVPCLEEIYVYLKNAIFNGLKSCWILLLIEWYEIWLAVAQN